MQRLYRNHINTLIKKLFLCDNPSLQARGLKYNRFPASAMISKHVKNKNNEINDYNIYFFITKCLFVVIKRINLQTEKKKIFSKT